MRGGDAGWGSEVGQSVLKRMPCTASRPPPAVQALDARIDASNSASFLP